MFSLTTHSRSAGLASTMIWLGLTIALLSSLTPDGYPTSVWSHYDTISGFNFFDSFTFINRWDNTTHSAAYYVSKAEAQKLSLAYVDQNARAIIAVDTTKDISADVMPAVFLNTTTGTFKYNRTALRSSGPIRVT
ncbi:hypothetical protein H4Q26_012962 [Puccinia striiformis f. sp. tritici PST-130]|nr:hypothetical protein H4Q26_012962 [Puccinia striiformis f. sp. tritici PST-130]